MSIEQLAGVINKDCEDYKYFWAYGTLKETASLWVGPRLSLLCDTARVILGQIRRRS